MYRRLHPISIALLAALLCLPLRAFALTYPTALNDNATATSSSLNYSLGVNFTPGDLVVILTTFGGTAQGSGANTSVSTGTPPFFNGSSTNLTLLKQVQTNVGGGVTYQDVEIWYGIAQAGDSGIATVHVTFSQSTFTIPVGYIIAEYATPVTSTVDGTPASNSGTSTSATTGSTTTTNANDILLAGIESQQTANLTSPLNSFVIEDQFGIAAGGTSPNNYSAMGLAYLDLEPGSSGSKSTGATVGSSVEWAALIGAIKLSLPSAGQAGWVFAQ